MPSLCWDMRRIAAEARGAGAVVIGEWGDSLVPPPVVVGSSGALLPASSGCSTNPPRSSMAEEVIMEAVGGWGDSLVPPPLMKPGATASCEWL